MVGLNFESLAYEDPNFSEYLFEVDSDDNVKVEKNYVLKFFVGGFIFLMIGLT